MQGYGSDLSSVGNLPMVTYDIFIGMNLKAFFFNKILFDFGLILFDLEEC